MEKQIDISEIQRILFHADDVFSINIAAAPSSTMKIAASVAGENAENIVIDIKETSNTLTISTGFTPFFIQANDKLAAHKVMSIELDVWVPENLYVAIYSEIASVNCFGNFKYFQAYLDEGTCTISDFSGNGTIQTKRGDIALKDLKDVEIKASSKTGEIHGIVPENQLYQLDIKTVSGDITILETN